MKQPFKLLLLPVLLGVVSGCAHLGNNNPFMGVSLAKANAMHQCGMGLVLTKEGALTTKVHDRLLDNPALSDERRKGVTRAYDLCFRSITNGFDSYPASIPQTYPPLNNLSLQRIHE